MSSQLQARRQRKQIKELVKEHPFGRRPHVSPFGRPQEPLPGVFGGLIIKLDSLRHENVFASGRALREFAIRAQHSIKSNRDRICLGPEFARLEIRQQTPHNPTRVFKGELNRVHTD